jgi:hypothetical protein
MATEKGPAGQGRAEGLDDSTDDLVNRQEQHKANGQQKQAETSAKEAWQQASPFPIAADPNKLKTAVTVALGCKTQLEAALTYASFGIPVFPCNWKPNKEGKVSKRPVPELGEGGLYFATNDSAQIKEWWTQWPEALIGVPGGSRTGVWFLDVDSMEGKGIDGLGIWSSLGGDEVQTRIHRSGTNGLHEIFLWDPDRPVGGGRGDLPHGLDV